jgi:16S rRNA G527 N7-methylase RsmG
VVVAARAEQLERRPGFEPFDVAVSRATLDLPDWLALGARLVRAGGLVLGMEGADRHPLPERAERIGYRLGKAERAIVKLPVFHVEHR